jgi:hypothetical protein
LDYYSELGALFDNDCHTRSRNDCYLNEEENKKLDLKRQEIETEHLFYNAVPCAAKVFGLGDDDNGFVDLKEGSSQITGKGDKYLYLRFTPQTQALHSFTIHSDSSNFELAYDFWNCNGRINIIIRPNKKDGYCQLSTQLNHVDFVDFDSTGPVFIGIKLNGIATVKVMTIDAINLTGKDGSVKTQYINNYQSYKYQSETFGYIIIKTTTQMSTNIKLYHNTEDCKRDKTTYPREDHYCLSSSDTSGAILIVPSTLDNGQLHYFGVQIGTLDRVEFNYDFVPMTEVAVGKTSQYKFDNTIATPFQVKINKGKYLISVQSASSLFGSECNIYADYDRCGYGLINKLPNKKNHCLSSNFNKSKSSCTLSFNLTKDGVVYFGIEAATKLAMSVLVSSDPKLEFLE